MKQHNELVKFKNSFISDINKQQKLTNILSEDMPVVVAQKMKALISLYRNQTAQNGYNEQLAYRIIILNLLFTAAEGFNLREQINRFFINCLQNAQLDKLRLCFDLLLIKEIGKALPTQMVKLLKIRLLRTMREYYQKKGLTKDKKKCGYTLEQYCKQTLGKEQIKRNVQIYCEILDIFIKQTKRRVSALIKRKNRIHALEALSQFTQILQKSEQIVTQKYQIQLMEAYWCLAILHDQMHYLAYTRKYAAIALNIAQRTQKHDWTKQIKAFIEQLI